jgi:hypothetical protein
VAHQFAPPKDRHVRAARKIDDDRIGQPRSRVIALDRAPQPRRLDPHDRIDLGIELDVSPEHFDANGVGFDAVSLAAQNRLNDKAKKRAELRRTAEHVAADHPLGRRSNLVARESIAECVGHRCHVGFCCVVRERAPTVFRQARAREGVTPADTRRKRPSQRLEPA